MWCSSRSHLQRLFARTAVAGVVGLVLSGLTVSSQTVAQAPKDVSVARVGDEAITKGELEARLAAIPPYQLARMGESEEAIARTVLDQMIEAKLMAMGARAQGLQEKPGVRERIRSVLASALFHDIRQQLEREELTDAEVKAFYEENESRYQAQERIRIWQITVASRKEAAQILDAIAGDAEPGEDPIAAWEKLAREKSLDQTTAMRRGDLGFVSPDGSTKNKDVQVPPEVYRAALRVNDGEVVPEPVKVGDKWMVIQRRGTMQTPERSLESEEKTIRSLLVRRKLEERIAALREQLRREHVSTIHPELVDQVEVEAAPPHMVRPRPHPGTLRKSRDAAGPLEPEGPPGQLR